MNRKLILAALPHLHVLMYIEGGGTSYTAFIIYPTE